MVLDLFDEWVSPESCNRRVLSVHVKSPIERHEPDSEMERLPRNRLQEIKVSDLPGFRKGLQVTDPPTPVQPLETFYKCHWSL